MFSDLTDTLVTLALQIIQLFPESPIKPLLQSLSNSGIADWLGYANYIIPVGTMIPILTGWLACIAAYYVYQIIMRWIKVIE